MNEPSSPSPRPDVDVVIPTFNWAAPLRECLRAIRRQQYGGTIHVYVVDSGSTDDTLSVARENGCEILERRDSNPQGEGINGRRNLGLSRSTSPLVWHLDGDNIVVEDDALERLVRPLLEEPTLSMAVPYPFVEQSSPPFNRWWSLRTVWRIDQMRAGAVPVDGWFRVPDMQFGLMNGTVLRRATIDAIGGWDQDTRMLARMREKRIASGAIVPGAHVDSPTNSGFRELARKFERRVLKFGGMNRAQLDGYFAEFNPEWSMDATPPALNYLGQLFLEPWIACSMFGRTRDPASLCGLSLPLVFLYLVSRHPLQASRIVRQNL